MNIKKLFKSGIKYLTEAEFRFSVNAKLGLYNSMPDEEYIKRKFKLYVGMELNLENPQLYCEKLQWLKLYDRRPEYTTMADKVAVRDYIAEKLGEEYLIPCLGVWDDPEDINFDALPDQFVLKCNHNSGLGMCICKDKSKLDIAKVKKELKKGLAQDYYLTGREWCYKDIKRKIIAEKFMVDESGTELKDYKVMCFGGKAKLIQVHSGRFGDQPARNMYDAEWNLLDFPGYPLISNPPEKPKCLEQMLRFSEELSKDIPQLRVDWYIVNGHLYLGELTFFDASGFFVYEIMELNRMLGDWVELPPVRTED